MRFLAESETVAIIINVWGLQKYKFQIFITSHFHVIGSPVRLDLHFKRSNHGNINIKLDIKYL